MYSERTKPDKMKEKTLGIIEEKQIKIDIMKKKEKKNTKRLGIMKYKTRCNGNIIDTNRKTFFSPIFAFNTNSKDCW